VTGLEAKLILREIAEKKTGFDQMEAATYVQGLYDGAKMHGNDLRAFSEPALGEWGMKACKI
jgi:hypothetical protein